MEKHWKIIGSLIFILMSTFFVHNVNASVNLDGYVLTDQTYSLSSSGDYQVYVNRNPSVWVNGALSWTESDTMDGYIGLAAFRTRQSYDVIEGNIYKLSVSFFWRGNTIQTAPGAFIQTVNSNQYFKTVAVEPVQCEKMDNGYIPISNVYAFTNVGYSCVYDIYVQSKTTSNRQILIGTENTSVMFYLAPMSKGIISFSQDISIFERSPEAAAEEKIEEQSEQGQNNSDQANSDNEQATSSLLNIAGSIISALTTSSSGSCSFNADLGNVDFGNLDLCSGKPPEFASIIDIIITLMIIPLIFMTVISLVHQFINLSKFAQGGD